jgi:predicted  nucleic acid-binding Zn-ribbon protein
VNGLTLLAMIGAICAIWIIRSYQVDLADARRRHRRLEDTVTKLRAEREELLDELDAHVEALTAKHPSRGLTCVK